MSNLKQPSNAEQISQTKHWSKIQERGTYIGMQALLTIYKLFGRRVLSVILYPVICYLYFTGGTSKKASLDYLKRVATIKQWKHNIGYLHGIKHFYTFAQGAFDKIDAWLGRIGTQDIIYSGEHPLAQIEENKQGAIFIGSHLGNLEVCRALSQGRYHARINVIVFTHHAAEFNRLLKKINPNTNVDLIEAVDIGPDLAIMLKERIDNGEILVITGDRTSVTSQGRSIEVDFLGNSAAFSQGPFILASILDCPVYFLFCLKEDKKFKVIFEYVADSLKFSRKNRQEKLNQVVSLFAQRLEYHCLLYPYQWFNFFDFWLNDDGLERRHHRE